MAITNKTSTLTTCCWASVTCFCISNICISLKYPRSCLLRVRDRRTNCILLRDRYTMKKNCTRYVNNFLNADFIAYEGCQVVMFRINTALYIAHWLKSVYEACCFFSRRILFLLVRKYVLFTINLKHHVVLNVPRLVYLWICIANMALVFVIVFFTCFTLFLKLNGTKSMPHWLYI